MPWTFYNASGQQLRSTATVLATQAEMEAGSSIAAFVTPGRTQYHPGVAKVWCKWESVGAHSIDASLNVASVSDGGQAGDTDLLWTTDFSTVEYAIITSADAGQYSYSRETTQVVGGTTIESKTDAGTLQDSSGMMCACFGDFA